TACTSACVNSGDCVPANVANVPWTDLCCQTSTIVSTSKSWKMTGGACVGSPYKVDPTTVVGRSFAYSVTGTSWFAHPLSGVGGEPAVSQSGSSSILVLDAGGQDVVWDNQGIRRIFSGGAWQA